MQAGPSCKDVRPFVRMRRVRDSMGRVTGGAAYKAGAAAAFALMSLAAVGRADAQPGQPAAPAPASDSDSDADEPSATTSTVTVTARKPPPQPGAVVGDIKPELQLGPSDIRSFGVSTVTELLNELAPETRSDRGRGGETPVVLLNGRRISSFSEIQNIPTEAILRVDILPEEVSLKYGYTADQRVVNIVLRRRFNAITGELQGGGPTEGGQATGQAEADLLHLRGDSRLNLDLKYQGQSNLTEANRDLTSVATGQPFDLTGNVVSPTSGGEIDPALSQAVGHAVTEAGVPAGLNGRAPTIADFAANGAAPNATDVSGDRTLLPATQQVTANAVVSRPIFWGLRATGNATLGATTSDSLQGLPGLTLLAPDGNSFSPFSEPVDVDRYASNLGPLRQSVDGWTAHLGTTLNKDTGDWRLSLTDAYDHTDTTTDTDAGANPAPLQALLNAGSTSFNPFGPLPANLVPALAQDTAHSRSDSGNIQILANGPLFKVPAGPFYASLKLGDTESLQNSTSTQAGVFEAVSLSRNDVNAQANLDLPLTSRDHHVFGFIGDLSVNVNGAVDELSDFGLLKTLGYGINWTPIDGVNLIVSRTQDQAAPTIAQLAGPLVQTPGTRLFDYVTGQTVDVTQVAGGNPDLVADHRQVTKVGLTWKPIPDKQLTVTANYIVSHISDPIATFPAVDAQIEEAFPDRFIRDADGTLTEEDDRAVNFSSQDRKELRWGFNYSQPLGPQPPPRDFRRFRHNRNAAASDANANGPGGGAGALADGSAAAAGAPDARSADGGQGSGSDGGSGDRAGGVGGGRGYGGGGGGGFAGGRGGRGFGGGRLQFAVYHTIYFEDRQVIRPGVPDLDFLNGAPIGETGGQYRNEIEAQAGFTLYGVGARLSADWRSATTVTGAVPGDTLNFSDLGTINFRVFDFLGQQPPVVARFPWLRGSRVSVNVVNLFDQRIRVHDADGITPLIYQSAYLDPAGRTITLSLRKLFY